MDWLAEVEKRQKRGNQVLFTKKDAYLQDVLQHMEAQTHQTLILWAFHFAEETGLTLEEKYPHEERPRTALETAKRWAYGKAKMPEAQRAILACHALAKELSSKEDIALCHAIGQACSVVHTRGHAIGFPVYDFTSLVRKYGVKSCKEAVDSRKKAYIEKLYDWQNRCNDGSREWSSFITKKTAATEQSLHRKR